MISAKPVPSRQALLVGEIRKLPAFLRRDFLIAWSYRLNFVSDWMSLIVQALLFSLIGKLIEPSKLPAFGGTHASYIEFVSIGISRMGMPADLMTTTCSVSNSYRLARMDRQRTSKALVGFLAGDGGK